uniref:CD8+ T cell target antigen Tp2 n=1 Tax=Theileria parva TaxID=5875 RepID=F6LWL1_THEPA|nr:CD8+ T cell target antigen Tp2 [Theileria parva]AEG42577.1 CD8+ T cell target antigen Tp2 [Theileria parva]AEG42578.1 CD8+ T cell target antigen Tp2 [Theileria parva]
MKLAARLISLYFIIFILPSSVLGGNCSDEELKKLGMLKGDGFEKERLFKTSHSMGMIGKRHALKTSPKIDKVVVDLETLFEKHGLGGVSKDCLKCFGQSVVCVLMRCRGACLKGPCSKDCQECIKRNCRQGLLECIGKEDVPNPCDWDKEYLKYRLPDTDEDESQKKGEASGTS